MLTKFPFEAWLLTITFWGPSEIDGVHLERNLQEGGRTGKTSRVRRRSAYADSRGCFPHVPVNVEAASRTSAVAYNQNRIELKSQYGVGKT